MKKLISAELLGVNGYLTYLEGEKLQYSPDVLLNLTRNEGLLLGLSDSVLSSVEQLKKDDLDVTAWKNIFKEMKMIHINDSVKTKWGEKTIQFFIAETKDQFTFNPCGFVLFDDPHKPKDQLIFQEFQIQLNSILKSKTIDIIFEKLTLMLTHPKFKVTNTNLGIIKVILGVINAKIDPNKSFTKVKSAQGASSLDSFTQAIKGMDKLISVTRLYENLISNKDLELKVRNLLLQKLEPLQGLFREISVLLGKQQFLTALQGYCDAQGMVPRRNPFDLYNDFETLKEESSILDENEDLRRLYSYFSQDHANNFSYISGGDFEKNGKLYQAYELSSNDSEGHWTRAFVWVSDTSEDRVFLLSRDALRFSVEHDTNAYKHHANQWKQILTGSKGDALFYQCIVITKDHFDESGIPISSPAFTLTDFFNRKVSFETTVDVYRNETSRPSDVKAVLTFETILRNLLSEQIGKRSFQEEVSNALGKLKKSFYDSTISAPTAEAWTTILYDPSISDKQKRVIQSLKNQFSADAILQFRQTINELRILIENDQSHDLETVEVVTKNPLFNELLSRKDRDLFVSHESRLIKQIDKQRALEKAQKEQEESQTNIRSFIDLCRNASQKENGVDVIYDSRGMWELFKKSASDDEKIEVSTLITSIVNEQLTRIRTYTRTDWNSDSRESLIFCLSSFSPFLNLTLQTTLKNLHFEMEKKFKDDDRVEYEVLPKMLKNDQESCLGEFNSIFEGSASIEAINEAAVPLYKGRLEELLGIYNTRLEASKRTTNYNKFKMIIDKSSLKVFEQLVQVSESLNLASDVQHYLEILLDKLSPKHDLFNDYLFKWFDYSFESYSKSKDGCLKLKEQLQKVDGADLKDNFIKYHRLFLVHVKYLTLNLENFHCSIDEWKELLEKAFDIEAETKISIAKLKRDRNAKLKRDRNIENIKIENKTIVELQSDCPNFCPEVEFIQNYKDIKTLKSELNTILNFINIKKFFYQQDYSNDSLEKLTKYAVQADLLITLLAEQELPVKFLEMMKVDFTQRAFQLLEKYGTQDLEYKDAVDIDVLENVAVNDFLLMMHRDCKSKSSLDHQFEQALLGLSQLNACNEQIVISKLILLYYQNKSREDFVKDLSEIVDVVGPRLSDFPNIESLLQDLVELYPDLSRLSCLNCIEKLDTASSIFADTLKNPHWDFLEYLLQSEYESLKAIGYDVLSNVFMFVYDPFNSGGNLEFRKQLKESFEEYGRNSIDFPLFSEKFKKSFNECNQAQNE